MTWQISIVFRFEFTFNTTKKKLARFGKENLILENKKTNYKNKTRFSAISVIVFTFLCIKKFRMMSMIQARASTFTVRNNIYNYNEKKKIRAPIKKRHVIIMNRSLFHFLFRLLLRTFQTIEYRRDPLLHLLLTILRFLNFKQNLQLM